MKKYTRRKGRRPQKQTFKKYLKTRRRRSRYGGASKRPSATPSSRSRAPLPFPLPPPPPPPPSKVPSRSAKSRAGILVTKNGVPVSQSQSQDPGITPSRASSRPPKTSSRNIKISKDDAEALQAARIIANFPKGMDKFLQMVINNYELLNYEGVKFALRQKISINKDPAVGRLSTNGIIFISYICGRLLCLLKELSTTAETDLGKKSELLRKIKQIEKVICLLDDVGCSWGVRPYNQAEMNSIAEYYTTIKDPKGLTDYHKRLNEFIDKYFPVLKKYIDPSHVVSSSMCRRLIGKSLIHDLPPISELESQPMEL